MPITVTVAATSDQLCVLDDLPPAVRSSTNDPYLDSLIRRVSTIIPRYLGRLLARQTYREDVAGYGSGMLHLFQCLTTAGLPPGGPITTLTSVQELDTENGLNPTTITDAYIADPMAGFIARASGFYWTAQVTTGQVQASGWGEGGSLGLSEYVAPGSERPLYRVVYTAGFTCPTISPPSEGTLPWDMKEAAVQLVTNLFYENSRDTTVRRRRIGDVELEYQQVRGQGQGQAGGMQGMTPSVIALLQPWKRVV